MTANRFRLAVFASGRGSNFRAIAQSCSREDFPAEVGFLITDKPEAAAIGIAEEFGIPWHYVDVGDSKARISAEAVAEIVSLCEQAGVELIFLAGFMRILEGLILERFAGRIMNIHPSLLPSFKGLNAQKKALEHGVKVAGATVHFVDDSLDGGPIVLQAAVPVQDDDDAGALRARILQQEHRIVSEAIALFARDRLRVEGRRVRIIP